MGKTDDMNDEKYIFGSLLVVANRIDTLLERELKQFDVTMKQWFLTLIIDNLFDEPPTMKEVAKQMGSSHQNVKQVALKLQEKGLLELVKDRQDARVTRLKLTEESKSFWADTIPKGTEFMQILFSMIEQKELTAARETLRKMLMNLEKLENRAE